MITKERLRNLLKKTIAEITFEKMDGTIRTMNATLMEEHLPVIRQDDPTEYNKTRRDENPKILAVWDMDKEDWRSFRVESVLKVNVIYPKEKTGVKYAAPSQK